MAKFEFSGIDDAINGLEQLQKNVDEINNKDVSLDDLFNIDFMRKHAGNISLNELLEEFGKNQEWLESLDGCDERFDRFISSKTGFAGWDDMLSAAQEEYVNKKLGIN